MRTDCHVGKSDQVRYLTTPGSTRPKDNRLGVRVLQAPPPHVSNVPCVL